MQGVYRWFWRLVAGNPLVVRVVQGGSRRPRHLWVRMGYLAALVGLVLFGLLSAGGLGGEVSLTDLAKAGTQVFAFIARGQVILVCLLAPLFMAGAIGSQQAGKTYDILLTTPLSNLQIVLGSLLGRLFFVLALLLSGLPLFAVLLVFGGVPVASVFQAFAVAALTALFVGSIAVMISVLRAGGRKAVFTFVIAVAGYLILAYGLDVVLLRPLMPGPYTTWLTPLHPLLVLEASLNSANYRPPPPEMMVGWSWPVRFYMGNPFGAFAALSGIASFVMLGGAAVVLRRVGQGESRVMHWLKGWLRIGAAGARGRQRRSRSVGANPIAWREANTRGKVAGGIVARWGFAILGLGAAIGLLITYHVGALPTLPGPAGGTTPPGQLLISALEGLLLLEVAIITLVAIYMSAGCVSREREDGTLDIMLTTPITPRQYIWGKLQGLVRFLIALIAVPVLTVALVGAYAAVGYTLGWATATYPVHAIGPRGAGLAFHPLLVSPEAAVELALMLVPFVAMCVAAGMSWSLKAKGVLGAVVPTVAVVGALSLVLGLCGWNAARNIPVVGPIVNSFSPATNLVMLLQPYERVEGFTDNPAANRVVLGVGALAAAGGYMLVVYALIAAMVKGFDQTVRRLSGTG